ncbi:MAG: type I CRISPR-associated protein Cas7 [Bacillota bacterium]|jgi:CRISPR-associated protein Csh2|nr:type I CRISPR-associated protein Cas7 [Bacillota bacterium]
MSMCPSAEIIFVKCVKDGIPNRDPLNDSDARRVFGEADGRISLSDVSIKRDVRDYVLAKYPNGGPNKDLFVYCREERDEKGKLLTRKDLVSKVLKDAGLPEDDLRSGLSKASFDYRAFGAVYSVSSFSFHQTGPVQFGWAHSLHPVETKYVQGTVVMPSDKDMTQGTIWSTYTLPFAVFAMPGVVNAALAEQTGFDYDDFELLLEALWRGTSARQARGRGIQKPVLLIAVEYADPFYRIGYLEENIAIEPDRSAWLSDCPPTQLSDVVIDVTSLGELLDKERKASRIGAIRYWADDGLRMKGDLPGVREALW